MNRDLSYVALEEGNSCKIRLEGWPDSLAGKSADF